MRKVSQVVAALREIDVKVRSRSMRCQMGFIMRNAVSYILIRITIFAELKNTTTMGMNKNTVLGWATFIMILMGLLLIGLGAFRYSEVSGWGFVAVE
jgi:hypothetical protein